MGSIDTLEIKGTRADPSRLLLYAHRREAEITCPVDVACTAALAPILSEAGATFWLRSVSREVVPFFGFWSRYKNYALVIRIKHGTSRREVSVPCRRPTGEALLALGRIEWSDAA